MNIMKCFTIIFCILFLNACGGGGGGGDSDCSDLNLKVTGGQECKAERSPVVKIISLYQSGGATLCTGTMVTVNDVLSAAHCFQPDAVGHLVLVGDVEYRVVSGAIHPRYSGRAGSPFDLAMVTIDAVLDIGPVPLILSDLTEVGEKITIFGYGTDENGEAGQLKAGNMIISGFEPGLFGAYFDESGSAICQGDSGGPATQSIDGVTGIVGVTSFNQGGCNSGSVSGFVDLQYPEIYEFIFNYAPDVAYR